MVARLVYLVDGQEIELEKMSLDSLDSLTYNAFGSEDEIIDSPRYEKIFDKLPRTGEVKVAYDALEVPIRSIDYFSEFGFDPFKKQTHYLSVLTGDRKISPNVHNIRENIVRTLCDIEVVEEFYETYKKEIIESRKNGNIEVIYNEIGEDNFNELNELIKDFSDIISKAINITLHPGIYS